MKHLKLWMFTLFALPTGLLQAQNIVGTWQGTLKPGPQDLRVVFKISLQDDKPKAVMYSIDQGSPAIPTTLTQSGSAIKIAVTAANATYEGKLSSDEKSITGTWSQGQPLPLNLVKATPETEWNIPEPAPPPKPMATDATPSFEVSTIKPARPDRGFSLLVNRSGMMNTTSTSLSDLIKFAYDLHPKQITGGPAWIESEKFDVTGKPDTPGLPSIKQLKGMVQKMLTERYGLAFHLEKKELPVYAITVAPSGQKLTKNDSNPNGLPGFGGGGPRGLNVRNSTMAEFGHMLQANVLDRPVVDQTGLGAARWDFIVKWTPDANQLAALGAPGAAGPAAATDPDAPPDLFTAFQQQLGLKLQTTKAPVDVLVIDKAEKPSAN